MAANSRKFDGVRFGSAISTGQRNTLIKFICRRIEPQRFAWPFIQLPRNLVQAKLICQRLSGDPDCQKADKTYPKQPNDVERGLETKELGDGAHDKGYEKAAEAIERDAQRCDPALQARPCRPGPTALDAIDIIKGKLTP